MKTLKELLEEKERMLAERDKVQESIMPQLGPLTDAIEALNEEINSRATELAKQAYMANGMDTGTVNITSEGVQIKASITKRVEWDQKILGSLYKKIEEHGDDPLQYMKMKLDVPEKNYAAWPEGIKSVFTPARTVKPSPPKFEFIVIDPEELPF